MKKVYRFIVWFIVSERRERSFLLKNGALTVSLNALTDFQEMFNQYQCLKPVTTQIPAKYSTFLSIKKRMLHFYSIFCCFFWLSQITFAYPQGENKVMVHIYFLLNYLFLDQYFVLCLYY